MKMQVLQNNKILYAEKTTEKYKGDKLFWWSLGIIFMLIGGIFLFIIFFRVLWLGLPSQAIEDITPGIIVAFVGFGFILMGVVSIFMSYTPVDLTIFDNGIVLPLRSLKQIIRKEVEFIPFNEIEKIYLSASNIPSSSYLTKEQLLSQLPRFLPPAVRKKINEGHIKPLKTHDGIGEPKDGDVILLLKDGDYEVIEEVDIEDHNRLKNAFRGHVPIVY